MKPLELGILGQREADELELSCACLGGRSQGKGEGKGRTEGDWQKKLSSSALCGHTRAAKAKGRKARLALGHWPWGSRIPAVVGSSMYTEAWIALEGHQQQGPLESLSGLETEAVRGRPPCSCNTGESNGGWLASSRSKLMDMIV